MTTFIYTLEHLPTSTFYIGSTTKTSNIGSRLFKPGIQQFIILLAALKRGSHLNPGLQASWAGSEDDYAFNLLEPVPDGVSAMKRVEYWTGQFPRVFNIPKRKKDVRHVELKHGADRFSDDVRQQVVQMLQEGMSGIAISKATKISQGTISNIRNQAGLGRGKRKWEPKDEQDPLFKRLPKVQ